ncbi:MAG: HNH endonuclease, partial [Actinobacteria bacterium]|nr:HNH endonuclease [Actinomycetota bacterium]
RDGPLCAVPGCTNPADVIHHDHRWEHNGSTDLDNGIPACDTHHDDFHEHRATIARNPDGTYTYTYTVLHPRTRAS